VLGCGCWCCYWCCITLPAKVSRWRLPGVSHSQVWGRREEGRDHDTVHRRRYLVYRTAHEGCIVVWDDLAVYAPSVWRQTRIAVIFCRFEGGSDISTAESLEHSWLIASYPSSEKTFLIHALVGMKSLAVAYDPLSTYTEWSMFCSVGGAFCNLYEYAHDEGDTVVCVEHVVTRPEEVGGAAVRVCALLALRQAPCGFTYIASSLSHQRVSPHLPLSRCTGCCCAVAVAMLSSDSAERTMACKLSRSITPEGQAWGRWMILTQGITWFAAGIFKASLSSRLNGRAPFLFFFAPLARCLLTRLLQYLTTDIWSVSSCSSCCGLLQWLAGGLVLEISQCFTFFILPWSGTFGELSSNKALPNGNRKTRMPVLN
jgi:hypothetical protein